MTMGGVPTRQSLKTAFFGKTWTQWASMMALSALGLFSIPFGVLFWTGLIKDANDRPRPEAGPPMVLIGTFMLLAACGAFYGIIVRQKPLVEIYRDGVLVRSGHHALFVHWQDYQGAKITGFPGKWLLTLNGAFFHSRNNKRFGSVQYRQDRFIDPLQTVVGVIEHFRQNIAAREQLPARPSSNFPVGISM